VPYLLTSSLARFAAGGHRNGSGRHFLNEAWTGYTCFPRPLNAYMVRTPLSRVRFVSFQHKYNDRLTSQKKRAVFQVGDSCFRVLGRVSPQL
jgi:hypothetical protein